MKGPKTSQRARLLALMAAIVVVSIIGQSALIRFYLTRDFRSLEETQVQASLRLIQLWLDRFLQPLEVLSREIGTWPEFTEMVTAQSTEQSDESLRRRLLSLRPLQGGYDVVGVVDAEGRMIFSQAFDRNTGAEIPLDAALVQLLTRNATVLRRRGGTGLAGWTVVPGGMFALASHAAPLPGGQSVMIVSGRSFSETEMMTLDDVSGTHVTTVSGPVPIATDDDQPMQACTRLSPALNDSSQQLCVRLETSILQRGLRSSEDLRLASLAAFIALLFATWLFIDRSLLRRLARLTGKLKDTTSAGTEALEYAMLDDGERGDELGSLSQGLGRMLGRLRVAEGQLRERERSFRALAEFTGVAIFVLHDDGVVYSNPFASQLTGIENRDLYGRSISGLVHEDWRPRVEHWLQRGGTDNPGEGQELRGVRVDGAPYWARFHIARIEYEGAPAWLVTLFDVSEQRHLERAVAEEKENLQMILSSIHDGIISVDEAGRVGFLNPAAQRLTGIEQTLAKGSALEEVLYLTDPDTGKPLRVPLIRTLAAKATRYTLANVTTPQGLARSVEVSISHRDGGPGFDSVGGSVLVMRDVSDLRQLTHTLSVQASHDDLTGLINRREFGRRVQDALENSRRTGRPYALCYLDLDQFKLLNDTCGHHAGDLMLREITNALRSRVRAVDTLARLGGDEFGLLLDDCNSERALSIANALRALISAVRFAWNGQNFSVDVSVGIVMLEHVEGGVDEALALADAACYMSKDLGRNRAHLYRPSDVGLQEQLRHMRWATRLKEAVEQGQFCLYAQTIHPIAAHAPNIGAVEALVRMRQSDGRIVMPDEFLAAAERYQMMTHIDRWVVSSAFAALSREHALGRSLRPRLFVNLSGQSLGDESFRDFLLDKLAEYSDLAPQLVFEVTESAIISSLSRAKKLMDEVYARGSAFALDDFGTGMSSFSYLKEMRVDYLKIAGSFVKNIHEPLDAAVCRSFTGFARMLNLTTIAEWVEDESILEVLREMGVDYGQGWHYSRAEPIEQVLGLTE